jgi:hypothetical protein
LEIHLHHGRIRERTTGVKIRMGVAESKTESDIQKWTWWRWYGFKYGLGGESSKDGWASWEVEAFDDFAL